MDHPFNLSAIKKKMKNPPEGQRMHHFFWGAYSMLSVDQINEIEKIITDENKKMQKYLAKAKKQLA